VKFTVEVGHGLLAKSESSLFLGTCFVIEFSPYEIERQTDREDLSYTAVQYDGCIIILNAKLLSAAITLICQTTVLNSSIDWHVRYSSFTIACM